MRTGFEDVVLPHLDSAYRLALWLLANTPDAEDAVEEAVRRARRQLHTLAGTDARVWLLGIVHRTCSGWQGRDHVPAGPAAAPREASPIAVIRCAIASLPTPLREVIVLRDLEDLPYRDVADVIGIPVDVAASRLSAARQALYRALGRPAKMTPPLQEKNSEVESCEVFS